MLVATLKLVLILEGTIYSLRQAGCPVLALRVISELQKALDKHSHSSDTVQSDENHEDLQARKRAEMEEEERKRQHEDMLSSGRLGGDMFSSFGMGMGGMMSGGLRPSEDSAYGSGQLGGAMFAAFTMQGMGSTDYSSGQLNMSSFGMGGMQQQKQQPTEAVDEAEACDEEPPEIVEKRMALDKELLERARFRTALLLLCHVLSDSQHITVQQVLESVDALCSSFNLDAARLLTHVIKYVSSTVN